MFLSELSKFATSPIREEDETASDLISRGNKVIKLNTGDPAIYLKTPEYILNAYIDALKANRTFYSDSRGVSVLREAVAKRYKRNYGISVDPDKVIVTQGLSEALYFLNTALIDKGDEAVLIRPYYPAYIPYLEVLGGKATLAEYDEDRNWEIDLDKLEKTAKSAKGAKYMLITTPNNPTGGVLQRGTLEGIVEIAKNYDIFLVSDEIYDELVYEKKFVSLSEVAKGIPHIVMNGASKNFDATGFRIGYVVFPNEDKKSEELLRKIIDLAKMRLSANTPAQYALAEGLDNEKEHERSVAQLREEIRGRVIFVTDQINKSEFMHAVKPQGAFYVFPKVNFEKLKLKDDKEFVRKLLLEEFVQVTRGSGFGAPNHIRVVALPSKDVLNEAINKIEKFCKKYSK